jgi:hypothetical protein
MNKSATIIVILVALAAMTNALANRGVGISLGYFSEQAGPAHAVVGAHITARSARSSRAPGSHRGTAGRAHDETPSARIRIGGATTTPPPVSYPSIPESSPLLSNPTPRGPDTFWYSDGGGHACVYVPIGSALCYSVTGPAGNALPALNPAAIAASASDRLSLVAGRIETSPLPKGLTGADSWFWLDPAPKQEQVAVSLAGENVEVVADPTVEWRFGDGVTLDGGGGVPYAPGPAPGEAIRHVYGTRCLPGDQGRNPYVLASCGESGYRVEALIVWRISYQAQGAVAQTGALPARTTESSMVYPVSEARAFLVTGPAT